MLVPTSSTVLCGHKGMFVTYSDKQAIIPKGQGRLAHCGIARRQLSCRSQLSRNFNCPSGVHLGEAGAPMEMRKEIRYRLDAPAVFTWESARHRRFQGEGLTRDISVQGAFILTATMPPPDSQIQVDLLLPTLTGVKAMMRITGKARVIRVEHPGGDAWVHGFAVVTDDLNQWGLVTMQGDPEVAHVAVGRAH